MHAAPDAEPDPAADVLEDRLWKRTGWIARVIKNQDDDGWAVEMTRIGDAEPALVGPWTMGRDKRNPKPLDQSAFTTLIKTASEVLRRHEHAARERLHRTLVFTSDAGVRVHVDLDLVADDDDPHAILRAIDEASGDVLRMGRVQPTFKLTASTVQRFIKTGEG